MKAFFQDRGVRITLGLLVAFGVLVLLFGETTGFLLVRLGRRITAGGLDHVLSAIAWPCVVLVAVILFRGSIRELIDRLHQVKPFGDSGTSFLFNPPKGPPPCEPKVPAPAGAPKIDSNKTGHLYWLGADLTSLIWHLSTNGRRDNIYFYLRQANYHMKKCGLDKSEVQGVMQRLFDEGGKKISSDWTAPVRQQYAQDAFGVLQAVARIAEAQQGDFVGGPANA